MPSPVTGGDAVVDVGGRVVLVVDDTVVLVVVVGITVVDVEVDGTLIDVVVVVVSPGSALELDASAIGTTNATTAMNTVAPELMTRFRQWSLP